jgi:hypothetical protein
MPDDAVGGAQRALGGIVFELLGIQERLQRIDRGLPVPPDQEAMLADEIAPDLATELSGRIECIAEADLREVIESLQCAACLTARELERDFRERQKRWRRLEGR